MIYPVDHRTTLVERIRMASLVADMQEVITGYRSQLCLSKQAVAQANNVPPTTLRYRLLERDNTTTLPEP
jgi:hypothetical protein